MSTIKILPENKDAIVEIPLGLIRVEKNWNGRSGKWEVPDGDETSQQFNDLFENMKEYGQKDPVGVRVNTENPVLPYELVKGFRRYAARKKIADERQEKNPTIRCIVSRLSDVDARIENILENTGRSALKPADLCWSIQQLVKTAKANNTPLTGVQIAKACAIDQSWCNKLMRIGDGLKSTVLDKWRTTPATLSVDNMLEVIKLPKDDQQEEFNKLVRIEVIDGEERSESGRDWVSSAKKRGAALAEILGNLEREGLINTDPLDFDEHLEMMVKLNRKCTSNNRRSIAAAMRKAWEAAKNRVDPVEEEEEVDESNRTKPKRRDY